MGMSKRLRLITMAQQFQVALVAVLMCVCYTQATGQRSPTKSASAKDSTLHSAGLAVPNTGTIDNIYQYKKELFVLELQLRGAGDGNAESILYQSRLALVTFIVAFLVFILEKSKKDPFPLPPWQVLVFTFIFVFLMYVGDSYITDLGKRTADRINDVFRLLNELPTMTPDGVAALTIYPPLDQPGILRKLSLWPCPNYGQVLAYTPVTLLLVLMFFRTFSIKPKSSKDKGAT